MYYGGNSINRKQNDSKAKSSLVAMAKGLPYGDNRLGGVLLLAAIKSRTIMRRLIKIALLRATRDGPRLRVQLHCFLSSPIIIATIQGSTSLLTTRPAPLQWACHTEPQVCRMHDRELLVTKHQGISPYSGITESRSHRSKYLLQGRTNKHHFRGSSPAGRRHGTEVELPQR